jgi:hypothetical protein
MTRGKSLALAAALVGGLLLAGVAQAASPLTLRCVRKEAEQLRANISAARAQFKQDRAACYGPGAACAIDCTNAADACLAPVAKDLEDANDACNAAQRLAIDECRSLSETGASQDEIDQCANIARLAGLECKLAATDSVDERRLACNQAQADCLASCASCGLPSQCPQ